MTPEPYPLLFDPIYKDYVWGGTRIPERFGRTVAGGPCAESWELADRPEGTSRIRNGPLTGQPLPDVIRLWGARMTVPLMPGQPFPLLVKLIDARETLSVQVHPAAGINLPAGAEPKSEMWHILEADPDACVFAGLQPGISPDRFRDLLDQGAVETALRRIPVEAGMTVNVPAGRVHAIGRGCLLLEIQQNSNTTYRVFDWNRVGADGRPRPLHREAALACIAWDDVSDPVVKPVVLPAARTNERNRLVRCAWFDVESLLLHEPEPAIGDGRLCDVLVATDRAVTLSPPRGGRRLDIPAGSACLVPVACQPYGLQASGDLATCLRVRPGTP